jgi:hypothetical protein
MSSANQPTTPPKPSDTQSNAAERLEGRGTSQSPMSKFDSAINVGAKLEQNQEAANEALAKGTSSQEKRKKT